MRNRTIEHVEHGAAEREAGEHLPDLAAVERGHEQAERSGREHHPGREPEQTVEQAVRGPG
jgi:hypothetical protein